MKNVTDVKFLENLQQNQKKNKIYEKFMQMSAQNSENPCVTNMSTWWKRGMLSVKSLPNGALTGWINWSTNVRQPVRPHMGKQTVNLSILHFLLCMQIFAHYINLLIKCSNLKKKTFTAILFYSFLNPCRNSLVWIFNQASTSTN